MRLILRGALVAAITVVFSVPAMAGTAYEWVTDDGVYSYADVLKRVPPTSSSMTVGKDCTSFIASRSA